MSDLLTPDLCIIGAGSGGLVAAAGAAQVGASVVLIEKGAMGGDCLNYGCVPSKALIAAGKRAQAMRTTKPFGITPTSPVVSPKAVNEHVMGVIARIAPNDSVERFTGLGVRVIQAAARFQDRSTVVAGDFRIKARRFVVATGSTPAVPPIQGLDQVRYFTNETIFDNQARLDHLIVIGAGPIGLELAQAHLRLGGRVTVLESMKALAREDPEISEPLIRRLREEGLVIAEGVKVEKAEPTEAGVRLTVSADGETETIEGSHILVATGRTPSVDGLGLDAAGIRFDRRGIIVNRSQRTSNRRVYAVGDVAGGPQFTHVASYQAGIVLRHALFRLPAKANPDIYPRVTFTEPEVAHVGLSEDEARSRHGKRIAVMRWPYSENDRAQAERATEGFVKVIATANGRILGASILGAHAGELIQPWALAITAGLGMKAMADTIVPYPTFGEINKRVAFAYFQPRLQSPMLRSALKLMRIFG